MGANIYMPDNILSVFLFLLNQKIMTATLLSSEKRKSREVKEHAKAYG